MNLCFLCVLCSHRPHFIERLFLVVIFRYVTRFGQAFSSLFHIYVLYIYLVFAEALVHLLVPYIILCYLLRRYVATCVIEYSCLYKFPF